jgi:hypothetical protein
MYTRRICGCGELCPGSGAACEITAKENRPAAEASRNKIPVQKANRPNTAQQSVIELKA